MSGDRSPLDLHAIRHPLFSDLNLSRRMTVTVVHDLSRVSHDLIKRQSVPLDQTGGLDVLHAVLDEPSGTFCILEEKTPTLRSRLRGAAGRTCTKLAAWATGLIQTVREAGAWLASGLPKFRRRRRSGTCLSEFCGHRHGAVGRHRVQTRWFGTQRSTASRVAIQRAASRPTDSEPALSRYVLSHQEWLSHMERVITAIQGHNQIIGNAERHRFVC